MFHDKFENIISFLGHVLIIIIMQQFFFIGSYFLYMNAMCLKWLWNVYK
jgi:hypothetical protein